MTATDIQLPSTRAAATEKPATSCGEWIDDEGTRCGLPAQILGRSVMLPVEHVRTRCSAGHVLNCPVESVA